MVRVFNYMNTVAKLAVKVSWLHDQNLLSKLQNFQQVISVHYRKIRREELKFAGVKKLWTQRTKGR